MATTGQVFNGTYIEFPLAVEPECQECYDICGMKTKMFTSPNTLGWSCINGHYLNVIDQVSVTSGTQFNPNSTSWDDLINSSFKSLYDNVLNSNILMNKALYGKPVGKRKNKRV